MIYKANYKVPSQTILTAGNCSQMREFILAVLWCFNLCYALTLNQNQSISLLGSATAVEFQYTVSDPTRLQFKLVFKGDAWLGFGLAGSTGGMLGATVMLGTLDGSLPMASFRSISSRTAPVSSSLGELKTVRFVTV
jgi:hypothetical protein